MRPAVLISLCLMGIECRYDGGSSAVGLGRLGALCRLIPVCPEQLGGLPTPRTPSERLNSRVVTRDGADVTAAFERGADQACRLADIFGARFALLKARSPSCGSEEIYDGSFTGVRVPGDGVTARRLKDMGIRVYDENHIDDLIHMLEGERV